MGSGPEKGRARLIYSGRSENLGVADDELLRPRRRLRGEAWHACSGQGADNSRIVKVVVERPVAGLSVVEIDPLSDLVVGNCAPLAVIRIGSGGGINIRGRNERESSNRRWRPRTL